MTQTKCGFQDLQVVVHAAVLRDVTHVLTRGAQEPAESAEGGVGGDFINIPNVISFRLVMEL